ncbi:MAG TPA: hypothetical protein VIF14_09820 [Alphaproteobacteria bacterium]|jgi:hypothetical protein
MRIIAALCLLALASPAFAQSADISLVWRGGLATARDLYAHPQMAPVLERLLGVRSAAFKAATARPDLLERHAGQIVVGTACASDCAAGGAFVVADTRRGEVLVLLVAPDQRGAARIERFETPRFPFPTETVFAAMEKWQAKYR